jgi:hypothetical protein
VQQLKDLVGVLLQFLRTDTRDGGQLAPIGRRPRRDLFEGLVVEDDVGGYPVVT